MMYPKLKEVDDVLGGAAAWENVDHTDGTVQYTRILVYTCSYRLDLDFVLRAAELNYNVLLSSYTSSCTA